MGLHITADSQDLDGEVLLCGMFLRQLVLDLRHPRDEIRQEAQRFAMDRAALQGWCVAAWIDTELFQQRLAGLQRLWDA